MKSLKILIPRFAAVIMMIVSIYVFHDIDSVKMTVNAANETSSISKESTVTSETERLKNDVAESIVSNEVQSLEQESSSLHSSAFQSEQNSKNETKSTTTSEILSNKNSNLSQSSKQESKPASSIPPKEPIPVTPINPNKKYIVGYYASWGSPSGFYPSDIDAAKLTHINYAFAEISTDNKLILTNSSVDLKNFEGLRKLKNKNSSLKLLISVGGWGGSKYFSNVALTAQSRNTFANSCVDFLLKNGFDGIDLDWEFPVTGGYTGTIHRPEDKQNFTQLIKVIRQKLDEQSKKDFKKYYLTIAGSPSTSYIKNIELTNILPHLDYIFIMGYDLHGPWDQYADFNAPLYNPKESSPQYKISVNDAVRNYLNAGASSSKLVLGMPFYGYKYTLTSTNNNGLYQTFSKAVSIGYDKVVSDYLSNSLYSQFLHSQAKVPYLFGNQTFITYEDVNSIALKVQLAKDYNIAGVGAWELSHDRNAVLLTSCYNTLY